MLGPDISVIADVIERNAARYPDKVALASSGTRISFGEFAARVQRLAANLGRLGLAKGSRVAILSRNRPEYLEVICASVAGFISVPLNWRLSVRELGANTCRLRARGHHFRQEFYRHDRGASAQSDVR